MMTSSALLYSLSFGMMLAFLLLVVALLFILSLMRQTQLNAHEERLAASYRLNAAAVRRYIPLITAPTERVIPWYVRVDETSTGIPKYTGSQITPGPVIAPLRPQESLLYADTLAQPGWRTPEFSLTA